MQTTEMKVLRDTKEAIYREDHLLTESDLQIVALDLPERIQLIDSMVISAVILQIFAVWIIMKLSWTAVVGS